MNTFTSSFSRQTDVDFRRDRWTEARSDAAIEEEIWAGILKDRSLGPKYQENIDIDVENGQVKISGHVAKQWHSPLILNITERVEGVAWVKSELIADNVLRDRVLQALLEDETTSPYIFTVKSSFGWIHLSGLVPSRDIAKAAEAVVSFVPTVRGVLSLPSVIGFPWMMDAEPEPPRRTLQPRIGTAVYQDSDGPKPAGVGLVSQVVIDPFSRLVSAIGVRLSGKLSAAEQGAEWLIPVSSLEAVNKKGVWLAEGAAVEQLQPFERKNYPYAPVSWRPPFPYLPGTVRWSI